MSIRSIAVALALVACSLPAQVELTTNGDFETGSFTGWQLFPSQAGNITIGTGNGSTFGADVANTLPASNSFLRHSNLGAGQVNPGQAVMISLDLRGVTAVGGIVFVQVFWEVASGGISGAQLLGPIFADPNPAVWTTHSFMATAGSDVSGGVSIQLEAVTGGDPASMTVVTFDNVSVSVMSNAATYPGSGDDLALTTGINGPANSTDVEMAAGGDTLVVNVASPGATYDLSPYTLSVQSIATAGGVPNLGGISLPDIYIDLSLPFVFLVDSAASSPTGPAVLGPVTGSSHYFILPPSLNGLGQSLVFQGLVFSATAANGSYAITNAHEIVIP